MVSKKHYNVVPVQCCCCLCCSAAAYSVASSAAGSSAAAVMCQTGPCSRATRPYQLGYVGSAFLSFPTRI